MQGKKMSMFIDAGTLDRVSVFFYLLLLTHIECQMLANMYWNFSLLLFMGIGFYIVKLIDQILYANKVDKRVGK